MTFRCHCERIFLIVTCKQGGSGTGTGLPHLTEIIDGLLVVLDEMIPQPEVGVDHHLLSLVLCPLGLGQDGHLEEKGKQSSTSTAVLVPM